MSNGDGIFTTPVGFNLTEVFEDNDFADDMGITGEYGNVVRADETDIDVFAARTSEAAATYSKVRLG